MRLSPTPMAHRTWPRRHKRPWPMTTCAPRSVSYASQYSGGGGSDMGAVLGGIIIGNVLRGGFSGGYGGGYGGGRSMGRPASTAARHGRRVAVTAAAAAGSDARGWADQSLSDQDRIDEHVPYHEDQVGEPALQAAGVEPGAEMARDQRADSRGTHKRRGHRPVDADATQMREDTCTEFATMISSDVPMAMFISTPSNNTSAGMIRKPPPTPNRPVGKPTSNPAGMDRGAHRRQLIPESPTLHAVPDVPLALAYESRPAPSRSRSRTRSTGCDRCLPMALPAYVAGMPAAAKWRPTATGLSGPDLGKRADRGCDTDDEQRHRNGLLDPEAQHVDQRRHRQDGPTSPSNPSSTPMRAPRARARATLMGALAARYAVVAQRSARTYIVAPRAPTALRRRRAGRIRPSRSCRIWDTSGGNTWILLAWLWIRSVRSVRYFRRSGQLIPRRRSRPGCRSRR